MPCTLLLNCAAAGVLDRAMPRVATRMPNSERDMSDLLRRTCREKWTGRADVSSVVSPSDLVCQFHDLLVFWSDLRHFGPGRGHVQQRPPRIRLRVLAPPGPPARHRAH